MPISADELLYPESFMAVAMLACLSAIIAVVFHRHITTNAVVSVRPVDWSSRCSCFSAADVAILPYLVETSSIANTLII
jgi:hypothetical protein